MNEIIWDDYKKRAEYENQLGRLIDQNPNNNNNNRIGDYKGVTFSSPIPYAYCQESTLLQYKNPKLEDSIEIHKYYIDLSNDSARGSIVLPEQKRIALQTEQDQQEAIDRLLRIIEKKKVKKAIQDRIDQLERDWQNGNLSWVYYQWKKRIIQCFS